MTNERPNYFKRWRQAKGVSAYRLAKLIGVHPSFISNVEANRRPMSEEMMRKLAAIPELGITYTTLKAWKLLSEYTPEELQEANKHFLSYRDSEEESQALDTGAASSMDEETLTES